MSDLSARLLAAHSAGHNEEIISLYTEAADGAELEEQEAFFLTQAWVFSLESNDPRTEQIRLRLAILGRVD